MITAMGPRHHGEISREALGTPNSRNKLPNAIRYAGNGNVKDLVACDFAADLSWVVWRM